MSIRSPLNEMDDIDSTARIDELERKCNVIRERISVYDKIVNDAAAVSRRLDAMEKAIFDRHEAHTALENAHKVTQRDNKNTSEVLQRELASHKDKAARLEEKVFLFGSLADEKLGCVKKEIESLAWALGDRIVKKVEQYEFESFKASFASQNDEIRAFSAILDEKISKTGANLAELVKHVQAKDETLSDLEILVQSLGAAFQKAAEIVESRFLASQDKLTAQYVQFQDKILKMLEDNKNEILGTPAANVAIEKRIMDRFEMTSLDSNNAVMKTSNAEQKIKILEKKIEALTLQLSKYEMSR